MKIKYRYLSLRFPDLLATLCHLVEVQLNAYYIDLPFLLPIDSNKCKYNMADTITFMGKKYYMANEKMDVCFKAGDFLPSRCFGLINVATDGYSTDFQRYDTAAELKYIFWCNFVDNGVISILESFEGESDIRIYSSPSRVSATLLLHR